MRGRKPLPAQMHVIRGSGPRRTVEGLTYGTIAEHDFPPPPAHLNADGAELWETMGRELTRCGVVQTVDLYALAQMAYMWQRHLAKAKTGADIISAEVMALKSLFAEFGMTPSSRRRFGKDDGATDEKKNRFKKFRPQ